MAKSELGNIVWAKNQINANTDQNYEKHNNNLNYLDNRINALIDKVTDLDKASKVRYRVFTEDYSNKGQRARLFSKSRNYSEILEFNDDLELVFYPLEIGTYYLEFRGEVKEVKFSAYSMYELFLDADILSWNSISRLVKLGIVKDHVPLGHEIPVTLSTGEIINFRVVSFDHYSEGDIVFMISKAREERISANGRYTESNIGGFGASTLCKWLNEDFYQGYLPHELKDVITDTSYVEGVGGTTNEYLNQITTSKLFIPSKVELFGSIVESDLRCGLGWDNNYNHQFDLLAGMDRISDVYAFTASMHNSYDSSLRNCMTCSGEDINFYPLRFSYITIDGIPQNSSTTSCHASTNPLEVFTCFTISNNIGGNK